MSNNLNGLVPAVIMAMERVLRRTGATFEAVDTDFDSSQAAKSQVIQSELPASLSASDVTPAATPPSLTDIAPSTVDLTLSKYRATRFHLTAEDWAKLGRRGPGVKLRQIDAAIAGLAQDIADYMHDDVLSVAGSYAFGTADTTPFGSDMDILADIAEALDTNLALGDERYGLISPAAKANLFKLDIFQKRNEAPAETSFAKGRMRELMGFVVGMDQSIATHTAGTGSAYAINGGDTAVGTTTLTVDTGSGTVLAGDAITIGGGSNQYIVETGGTDVTSIVLRDGLLAAIADDDAVAIQSDSARNVFLHKSAAKLAVRPPTEAPGGDMADDVTIVTDPVTGLSFRLAEYPGYHGRQYEVSAVYGGCVVRDELIMQLLG